MQHDETSQKRSQSAQHWGKKLTSKKAFFHVIYSCHPKEFKYVLKKSKMPIFSPGHHVACPKYNEFSKTMSQQITMSLEFHEILVCHQHVNHMSTTFPTKLHTCRPDAVELSNTDIVKEFLTEALRAVCSTNHSVLCSTIGASNIPKKHAFQHILYC